VKFIPLNEETGFTPDLDELKSMITERTKAIVINSPQNPTGAVWDRELLEGIAELATKRGVFLISDEVYEKLVFDGREHFSPASVPDYRENVVTIFSLSKTYAMTGWRLGFVVADKKLIQHMRKVTYITTVCASSVAQYAALEALTGPQDSVKEMIREYERRRDVIYSEISKIPRVRVRKPQGAFYLFPDLSEVMRDSWKLADYLLEKARVSVTPGAAFGSKGEGHIRISFATSEENLREGARRIREALSSI